MQSDTFYQLLSLSQPWLSGSEAGSSPDTERSPGRRFVGFDCPAEGAPGGCALPMAPLEPVTSPLGQQLSQRLKVKTRGGRGRRTRLQQQPAQRCATELAEPVASPRFPNRGGDDEGCLKRPPSSPSTPSEGEHEAAAPADQAQNPRHARSSPIRAPSPRSAAGFPASTSHSSSWGSQQGTAPAAGGSGGAAAGGVTPRQKPVSIFEQLYEARASAEASHAHARCLEQALEQERKETAGLREALRALAAEKDAELEALAQERDAQLQAVAYERDCALWQLAYEKDAELQQALYERDCALQAALYERDCALQAAQQPGPLPAPGRLRASAPRAIPPPRVACSL